jgi:hypothetical protein
MARDRYGNLYDPYQRPAPDRRTGRERSRDDRDLRGKVGRGDRLTHDEVTRWDHIND